MTAIGIIGLGLLGSAISRRLLAAGFAVSGYDIHPTRCQELAQAGGRPAANAAELAARSQYILLSLPTSDIAAAVLSEIAPAATVIDTTTGSPDQMESFATRGFPYLDATVAGSSLQVEQGEAVVMCGGDAATFESCRPIFKAFAREAFYCGPSGSGARMKLAVNLVLGLNRAVLAEGLVFAEALGLDPATTLTILKAGPAYSRAMDTKGRKMLDRDFTPEARLAQHHKDVRLILEEAAHARLPLPLSSLHDELLEQAEAAGYADWDNSAIIELFRRRRNA
ncbi:MAG: NAD(P)-dependent oxidoreductase [Acidobacteria bacterium]|nr:NAD(P)-dependent oxidoreductase [Acidobacteriota bacterium]